MNFSNNTDTYIELNLDNIFNENGYIDSNDEHYYKCNENVKSIKLIRTKDTAITIGIGFLSNCKNLTSIDLSPLSNITQIGDWFLSGCRNLTTIDLSPLLNVTQIGKYFLYRCSNLTTINLSHLSNVTQIGEFFLYRCLNLTTINLSHLSNVTQIGGGFLYGCTNLTLIDLSSLSNVTQIGGFFLSECINLTTINLSHLSNVTQIGNGFLSFCENLTTINLPHLSNVTQIGNSFLSGCSNLTTIDLSPLSKITQIDNDFLYYCENLTTIICDNHIIIQKIKNLNQNIKIKSKSDYLFSTYDKDIENIKSNEKYTQTVLKLLNIHYAEKNSHNDLIKKIEQEKIKYNERMTKEELDECINTEEIFSMEPLENIPKSKLIKINKIADKYYCFDVVALRNFIFKKQNGKCMNPYTNTEFTNDDIDKILSVDVKKIQYFS